MNPAYSGMIRIMYVHPVPSPNPAPVEGPPGHGWLPPIDGAEDGVLTVFSPKTYYDWEDPATLRPELAPIQAKLVYKKDLAPAIGKVVVFGCQGNFIGGVDNRTARTDINGVASWPNDFSPFGVGSSNDTASFKFFAQFWGY